MRYFANTPCLDGHSDQYSQEELMFEDISNPPKGKGKEKDVGKRRAYVRVVTSLGGGSLNLELFCEKVCFLLSCFRRYPKFWIVS